MRLRVMTSTQQPQQHPGNSNDVSCPVSQAKKTFCSGGMYIKFFHLRVLYCEMLQYCTVQYIPVRYSTGIVGIIRQRNASYLYSSCIRVLPPLPLPMHAKKAKRCFVLLSTVQKLYTDTTVSTANSSFPDVALRNLLVGAFFSFILFL